MRTTPSKRSGATAMSDPLSHPALPELIARKARRISRTALFRRDDPADLEQALWTHLCRRVKSFDPSRGSILGFATCIFDRHARSLARERRAAKRSSGREGPAIHHLEDLGVPDEGLLVDGWRARDRERDVAALLARLPDELRTLALELAFGTPNSASTNLGASRRRVARSMVDLRAAFEDAGLRDYL